MIDNRNYIIAIGLSILIVIGWQYFVMGPRMEAERLRRVEAMGAAVHNVLERVDQHTAEGTRRAWVVATNVYLKTTQMSADTLPQKVKDMLTNKLDKTVYLRADARARYEKVVEVVDNLRSAGVDQLGLLTEELKKKTESSSAPVAGGTATPAQ